MNLPIAHRLADFAVTAEPDAHGPRQFVPKRGLDAGLEGLAAAPAPAVRCEAGVGLGCVEGGFEQEHDHFGRQVQLRRKSGSHW